MFIIVKPGMFIPSGTGNLYSGGTRNQERLVPGFTQDNLAGRGAGPPAFGGDELQHAITYKKPTVQRLFRGDETRTRDLRRDRRTSYLR